MTEQELGMILEQHDRMVHYLEQIKKYVLTFKHRDQTNFIIEQIDRCVDAAFSTPEKDHTDFTGVVRKLP